MKKLYSLLLVAAAGCGASIPPAAKADDAEGHWEVRVRAVYLDPAQLDFRWQLRRFSKNVGASIICLE